MGAAALVLVLASGILLSVGSFLGTYVRPTSDDWCAAWKTRDMGVFGITQDFYDTQNGRLANALVSGVVYSQGLLGPRLLPVVLVISLTLGMVLAVRAVWRQLGWRAPVLVVLAAVLLAEVLLFYAGTRPYQVLLWAPGSISHTLPTIIAVWSALLAIGAGRRGGRPARWAAVGYALLMGAVVGTLSEPFTVVSGVFVGAGGLLLLPRLRALKDWYPFTWCAAWCLGLVVGFVVLYTSPGARWRRQQPPHTASPLSPRQLKAEVHDWLRVWNSVGGTWVYLAALAVGVLLGLATAELRRDKPAPAAPAVEPAPAAWSRTRRWALLALPVPLIMLSSFGVVVGLRMGYGSPGWTYGRAWANFLFPMLLTLAGYGVLIGRRLTRVLAAPGPRWAVPAVVAVGLAATVTGVLATAQLTPVVQKMTSSTVARAAAWDRQDALIRREVAGGAKVVTYHPLVVRMLAEPFIARTYAHDWAAQCVAHYYRVDRIQRQPAPRAAHPRSHVKQHKPTPRPKTKPTSQPARGVGGRH